MTLILVMLYVLQLLKKQQQLAPAAARNSRSSRFDLSAAAAVCSSS